MSEAYTSSRDGDRGRRKRTGDIVPGTPAQARELRAQGCIVLLVEQNVHEALSVTDRFIVIERGQTVLSGDSEDKSDRSRLLTTLAV